MMFKSYAVLITIRADGEDYYHDRLIVARTSNEAHKVAQKLAHAAEKKQHQKHVNVTITQLKILGA